MTKRAASSSGTGRPRSMHACWIAPAMIDVESASVPSQSKTSRRNRFRSPIPRLPAVESRHESCQLRRKRRLEPELPRLERMLQRQPPCMQEHAFETFSGERFVPAEVAVLIVAGERKTEVRKVHADLMRAARSQLGLEQAHRRLGFGPHLLSMKDRRCRASVLALDAHAPFTLSGQEFVQRQLDLALCVAPSPADEDQIAFVDAP